MKHYTDAQGQDREIDLHIDPLNLDLVHAFRGQVHGDDRNGVTDLEFESLKHAASWAQTCEVEDRVILRGYDQRRFNTSVVVMLFPDSDSADDYLNR